MGLGRFWGFFEGVSAFSVDPGGLSNRGDRFLRTLSSEETKLPACCESICILGVDIGLPVGGRVSHGGVTGDTERGGFDSSISNVFESLLKAEELVDVDFGLGRPILGVPIGEDERGLG